MVIVREGKARIYIPTRQTVFYNSEMRVNRDITVLFLAALDVNRNIRLMDALAATGVKAIRIALESGGIEKMVLNDINKYAYQVMMENVRLNELESVSECRNEDAGYTLLRDAISGNYYTYIDLDPFGSPVNFVEPALKALEKNGFLGVTATDLTVLFGVYPKKCFRIYNALNKKTDFHKEIGLRILAGFIARKAALIGKSLEFLLAYYEKHYLRIFFTLKSSRKDLNDYLFDGMKLEFTATPATGSGAILFVMTL